MNAEEGKRLEVQQNTNVQCNNFDNGWLGHYQENKAFNTGFLSVSVKLL